MAFDVRCDDDWDDESGCPPCERPDRTLRDAASLIAALAPIVVAAIEYGPSLIEWARGKLVANEPPAEPKAPAAAPKKRRR